MLSQQEMSDRLEIQDLLVAYCTAIDSKNWEALDDIFTADAHIDYSAAGGSKGNLTETKAFLDKAMVKFPNYQHMLGLPQITLKGDTADVRTICFNPMMVDNDGKPHIFFVGIWYVDEIVRVDGRWRIKTRREELSYFHNLPEGFAPE